uniref:Uncharacterized protein n=1 Tax=Romanomermis culicivorax TaxID=13658 RepID=A0A915ID90_ROMCU
MGKKTEKKYYSRFGKWLLNRIWFSPSLKNEEKNISNLCVFERNFTNQWYTIVRNPVNEVRRIVYYSFNYDDRRQMNVHHMVKKPPIKCNALKLAGTLLFLFARSV